MRHFYFTTAAASVPAIKLCRIPFRIGKWSTCGKEDFALLKADSQASQTGRSSNDDRYSFCKFSGFEHGSAPHWPLFAIPSPISSRQRLVSSTLTIHLSWHTVAYCHLCNTRSICPGVQSVPDKAPLRRCAEVFRLTLRNTCRNMWVCRGYKATNVLSNRLMDACGP